ncbi:hypothetical protein [Streptomyces sp. NPDC050564]|uniref:hypothetical protein n=1 Tax=Streptomyces sp. NPDC050564 TaxID=3365631 RepID=UPI0037B64945
MVCSFEQYDDTRRRNVGFTTAVYAFEVADDRIKHIWEVRNPDKLRTWMMG